MVGALIGGASLILFPQLFLSSASGKWLNLLLMPVVVGGIMSCIGEWRRDPGEPAVGLEDFVYGYLFALSLALARLIWAEGWSIILNNICNRLPYWQRFFLNFE